MQELILKNLKCGHCVATVQQALEKVAGVTAVKVEKEYAEIEGDADSAELIKAVENAGFIAELKN